MHFIMIFSMTMMTSLMINANTDCNGKKCNNNQVCAKFCDKGKENNLVCGFNDHKCPVGYLCHNECKDKSDMIPCNPQQYYCPKHYTCNGGGICMPK
ncbi:unnamed protein product [Meloidogyne enterolobii]|uniref:Uncharacterized protein n=1 Tax=Meloidogyne enterolobii TaxID=390850 RepID=A0ACB0XPU8_MELEN